MESFLCLTGYICSRLLNDCLASVVCSWLRSLIVTHCSTLRWVSTEMGDRDTVCLNALPGTPWKKLPVFFCNSMPVANTAGRLA